MLDWQPIETLPEGEHVALYFLHGEKGAGGIECATVFFEPDGFSPTGMAFWTHGGPNSGSDWEPRDGERPTFWARLIPPQTNERS